MKRRTPKTKPASDAPKNDTGVARLSAWNRPTSRPLRNLGLKGAKRGNDLREKMREANKSYDRQNYEEASKAALDILKKHPRNIRMLRVVVSSACFMGDDDVAKKYYKKLPKRDQAHMRIRCTRMKINLDE